MPIITSFQSHITSGSPIYVEVYWRITQDEYHSITKTQITVFIKVLCHVVSTENKHCFGLSWTILLLDVTRITLLGWHDNVIPLQAVSSFLGESTPIDFF